MSITLEMELVPCRFGDNMHAVGHYITPNGCACFPEDKEQDLCGQHVIKGGMNEGYDLTIVYDIGFYKRYLGPTKFAELQRELAGQGVRSS